jgi:hypothetical protein
MTQATQVRPRTTVLTSALVAALVSLAITVSGLLIATSIVADPTGPIDPDAAARRHRAVLAGLEWQERYEQMYPTR